MTNPYTSKEFLALRAKWYAKLEKSGFKDIEYTNFDGQGESGDVLRGFSTMDAVRYHDQELADYHYRATQFAGQLRREEDATAKAVYARVLADKSIPWPRRKKAASKASKAYRMAVAAWEMHADGIAQAKIAKALKTSTQTLSVALKAMRCRMFKDPEMTGESQEDQERSLIDELGEGRVNWGLPTPRRATD